VNAFVLPVHLDDVQPNLAHAFDVPFLKEETQRFPPIVAKDSHDLRYPARSKKKPATRDERYLGAG
jgi:hypothetical protein